MKNTVMNESVYSCLKFSNTPHIFMHLIVVVLLKSVSPHFTFLLLKTLQKPAFICVSYIM